jgi:hypothetical protein
MNNQNPERPQLEDLKDWKIDYWSEPTAPGLVRVTISADNPALGPFGTQVWSINLDWKPGQERMDVEAFALQWMIYAVRGLATQLKAVHDDLIRS